MTTRIIRTLFATLLMISIAAPMSAQTQKGPVRHIVVFKYKPGTTEDQIRQVTQAFRDLRTKIPGITAFEDGVNNSP